jgi:hypothetical protein
VLADKDYVDGEREARLTDAGWRISFSVRAARTSRCRARRRGAIGALAARAPTSSMYLPAWLSWAARHCAALDWRGHAASELEDGDLQLEAAVLPEGVTEQGILTPEVCPTRRDRPVGWPRVALRVRAPELPYGLHCERAVS